MIKMKKIAAVLMTFSIVFAVVSPSILAASANANSNAPITRLNNPDQAPAISKDDFQNLKDAVEGYFNKLKIGSPYNREYLKALLDRADELLLNYEQSMKDFANEIEALYNFLKPLGTKAGFVSRMGTTATSAYKFHLMVMENTFYMLDDWPEYNGLTEEQVVRLRQLMARYIELVYKSFSSLNISPEDLTKEDHFISYEEMMSIVNEFNSLSA